MHPELRQAVLHAEESGLCMHRLLELFSRFFLLASGRENDSLQIRAEGF